MANTPVPAQFLAIIGLATVVGGVHSLIKPVHVDRQNSEAGFTIPGSKPSTGTEQTTPPTGGEANAPGGSRVGGEGSTGVTDPEDPSESPEPIAEAAQPETAPANGPTGVPSDSGGQADGNKIDLKLATELHERAMQFDGVWFLDARRRVDYDAGHIAGAEFMSHDHISSGDGLESLLMLSPPDVGDLLVIYCTGGDCQASEDTAILLEAAGYSNIAIMSAGYDEWVAAGLPTEGG